MSDSEDMVVVCRQDESAPGNSIANESEVDVIENGSPSNVDEPSTEEDPSGEREDITQALLVIEKVKGAIQFHDDEALQHALDKVKERPLIDAAFSEKIEMLQRLRNTESYGYFHKSIDKALEQLKCVQDKAKNGKTSLNRPIEILNEVLPIFEKACSIYMEKVELSGAVNKNLNQCDLLRGQIKACLEMDRQDVDEAKRLEKECDKLLEEGVRVSKADVHRILNKLKEEKEADILAWFESTRTENCEKMDYLTSDFQQMKENCEEDIQLIERTLKIEIESKDSALEKFTQKDEDLGEKIDQDLVTEEELKEKLRQVQEHRQDLEEDREKRKAQQERSNVVHKQTEDELQLLLDNLVNLHAKVGTADVVLRQTKDVCNKLFDKAVESKSIKNQDLDNVLVQAKTFTHVALIAQAVHCKNNVESQKSTVTYLNEKVSKRKQKLQDALRRKLSKEVKDHQDKLKNLSSDLESSKKVLEKSDEKLKKLLKDITELQKDLDEANVEYEDLDSAFGRFKKQEDGNDGYSISSMS